MERLSRWERLNIKKASASKVPTLNGRKASKIAYLWENTQSSRLMITFMSGFTVWRNIKPNLNIRTSVSLRWPKIFSSEEERNITLCAISKTFQKMAPIYYTLDTFINKSFQNSTGYPLHGRPSGNVVTIQNSKKCSNTKRIMFENLSNKFIETLLSHLSKRSSWV